MRIERIKLYNISSYSGVHELDFTVSEDRNIVLIGGQNGTGKTSLFTAIKLALYGPLCFHFQSKNNQYTARIKELISHDAFAQPEVRAYIELRIQLPQDRKIVHYTIRREWSYKDKRLLETDLVWEEDKLLGEKELNFFQNYLYHVIPPNLFDFFFFDGEEIAGFFSTPSYRTYLKEAVLTLSNYDTFGLIEKYARRYMVSDEDSLQAKKRREEYEDVCTQLEQADQVRQSHIEQLQKWEEHQQRCEQERADLEERFQKAGGLRQDELDELQKQAARLEKRRDQINASLKNFIEEMAPLVMTTSIAGRLRKQISLEQQMQQYRAVLQQISPDRLEPALGGMLSDFGVKRQEEFVCALSRALESAMKPDIDTDHFSFLHDLTREQQDVLSGILSRIERFQPEEIVHQVREKDEISQQLTQLRTKLEQVLSPEEVQNYELRLAQLDQSIAECKEKKEMERKQNEDYEKQLAKLETRRKTLRSALIGDTRKIEAVQYTERISKMTHEMVFRLLEKKRREIEGETLRLSKEILRKEHFIDLIQLDEKFDFALYREQEYTLEELASLLENVGMEELERRIGTKGVERLQERLHVESVSALKRALHHDGDQATLFDGKTMPLYKRIEFQQLSKGEKQVFILSLYWAIIKTSGRDIPFIIDTPYARIDTEHREQIARKFFPSISGQVIILSTDEEITPPYYRAIQEHIAQEYTLTYDEKAGQTNVARGYSFGGSSL